MSSIMTLAHLLPTLNFTFGFYTAIGAFAFILFQVLFRNEPNIDFLRKKHLPVVMLFWLNNYSIFLEPVFGNKMKVSNGTIVELIPHSLEFFEIHYYMYFVTSFLHIWFVYVAIEEFIDFEPVSNYRYKPPFKLLFFMWLVLSFMMLPIQAKVYGDHFVILPEYKRKVLFYLIHLYLLNLLFYELRWVYIICEADLSLLYGVVVAAVLSSVQYFAYIVFFATVFIKSLEGITAITGVVLGAISMFVSYNGIYIIIFLKSEPVMYERAMLIQIENNLHDED